MKNIKSWVRGGLNLLKLFIGTIIFWFTKKTPGYGYQGMVGLFCLTGGVSNDLISRCIALYKGSYKFTSFKGVLGNTEDDDLKYEVQKNLRDKGWHVFKNKLSPDVCSKLLEFALTHRCVMRPMDAGGDPIKCPEYHRSIPQATRYDFDVQDLLNNPEILSLLGDLSFAAVAQEYLGSKPVVDILSMWWHTDFSDHPDSNAAQYFHFDMDRPRWLKFFIYLTDVMPVNGPHSFVQGSHKTGGIPSELLRKGYVRLVDDEVEKIFGRENIIEFSAPAGTIIAEDTRGLHKGKHVEFGDRLVLQMQFSNSLFGAITPDGKFPAEMPDSLKQSIGSYPSIYSPYSK